MKRLLFLITPLLIFTLLFSACSPTEKDNYEYTLAYFQIDFLKSDFEMTESKSDKADYVRAYKVSVTEKERKKLIEHFKSFENGEFVKIPNAISFNQSLILIRSPILTSISTVRLYLTLIPTHFIFMIIPQRNIIIKFTNIQFNIFYKQKRT